MLGPIFTSDDRCRWLDPSRKNPGRLVQPTFRLLWWYPSGPRRRSPISVSASVSVVDSWPVLPCLGFRLEPSFPAPRVHQGLIGVNV